MISKYPYLDCLAFDMARVNAQTKCEKIPAFMCTTEETKREYRKEAIDVVNKKAQTIVPFSVDDPQRVENFLLHLGWIPSSLVEKWIMAEKALAEERKKNNPQAYFVS